MLLWALVKSTFCYELGVGVAEKFKNNEGPDIKIRKKIGFFSDKIAEVMISVGSIFQYFKSLN